MLSLAVMFTACDKHQQGEVEELNDMNKNTVEEAKNANEDKTTVKENCADLVVEAAHNNRKELMLSRVASDRASSKEVKVFAQQVIGDHAKTETELKDLAEKNSITLATDTRQDELDVQKKLEGKKGEDFDITYLDAMIDLHQKSVNRFEDMEECEAQDIKSLASQKLPVIQKHLDLAKMLSEAMKKKTKETYTEETGTAP